MFCLHFRFFLMYLINKDVTEHTGQVQLAMNLYWKQIFGPFQSERCVLNDTLKWETTDKRTLRYTIYYKMNCDCITTGIIRVEDVPGTLLGVLSCWRLFPETVWRSTQLNNTMSVIFPLIIRSWCVTQHCFECLFGTYFFHTTYLF